MIETLNNVGSAEANDNPTEKFPTFDEHMERAHRTHEQRLERFMEMSGIKEVRADEEKFDEALTKLDPRKAYTILSHMNIILRGGKLYERGRRANVSVGEHVAPVGRVQAEALTKAVGALKNIDDDKYRAAMSYYVINGLHMFPDGNGRTSRAAYEILENPNFNLAEEASLMHHDASESYGHGKFEKEKGIRSAYSALNVALRVTKSELIKSGAISEEMGKRETYLDIIYGDKPPQVFLTEEAEQELSKEEKTEVNRGFMDGDVALLALGMMLTEKGTYDDIAKACTHDLGDGKSSVRIEITSEDLDRAGKKNELAEKTFSGWSAEDYRKFVRTISDVQRHQYDHLIGIFASPDEYTYGDKKRRIADWLVGREK